MNLKFSANLGFLWLHLPMLERIAAAQRAGFDAVECHMPYDCPASDIEAALKLSGLPMVGLNTAIGAAGSDDIGLAAVPGQEQLARQYIDQAIDYAIAIGAANIHVVAGLTGGTAEAEKVYQDNLRYACKKAALEDKIIIIEPLNPRSVPNYHLSRIDQAVATIDAVGENNLKIMFDFFHMQIVHGDLATLLQKNFDYIGHIQIAAVHDRGEPDDGEINFPFVLGILEQQGYTGYIGAEYKPRGQSVESGLTWLDRFRGI